MRQLFGFLLALVTVLGLFPPHHAYATEIEEPVILEEETTPEETSAPTEETVSVTEETAPLEVFDEQTEISISEATVAASQSALEATIAQQIRAYAKSINKSGANDTASKTLAKHGMTGGGKKLSVGKSHALTATLMNSELLQLALIDGCAAAIDAMQRLGMEKLTCIRGNAMWYGNGESSHMMRVYDSWDRETRLLDWNLTNREYVSKRNAYDESLDWMAGTTVVDMELVRTKVTTDAATYKVSITVWDRFDFSIKGNAFFKDLISGIGALLFQEFDWEAKVSFELEVPYHCSHSTSAYHWSYDPESQTITSDGTGSWQTNGVTRQDSKITYYYELEKPIRLLHDKPWVIEYDVQKSGTVLLSPLSTMSASQPYLQLHGRTYLAVSEWERVKVSEEIEEDLDLSSASQTIRHYHGLRLTDLFKYSSKIFYTIRLENQVNPDGSNMIYLTVRNTETGKVLADRIPMDNYYKYESWVDEYILLDENDGWLCGKDLNLNYIGNSLYQFSAERFDLKVWENGEDGEACSYFGQTKVTAPTCTKKGYTTNTCKFCGYSYKDSYKNALGHIWDEGVVTTEPTEETTGIRTYTCTICGEIQTEEIPVLEHIHRYEETTTDPTCTEQGYTTYTCSCGDSYVDTYVTALGHDYESTVVAPTYTEPGYTEHTCTRCGHSFRDSETEPLGISAPVVSAINVASSGKTKLSWSKVEGAAKYEVYLATSKTGTYKLSKTITGTTFTHTGAVAGKTYYYKVKSVTADGTKSGYSNIIKATCDLARPEVTSTNVASSGKNHLTWKAIDGTLNYQVYRATSKTGTYKLVKTTTGTSYTDTAAVAGTTYYYRVRAIHKTSAASSANSAVVSRVCDLARPALTATNVASSGKNHLTWKAIDGTLNYQVYRATSKTGTYKLVKTTTGTSYTDTSAVAGKTYYYRIRAIHKTSAASSANSAVVSRVCDLARPEISVALSSNKPKVSWKKVSGTTKYEVYVATSKTGTYKLIKTTTGTSFTHTAATKGTTYYYRVRAIHTNSAASSANSAVKYIKSK